MEGVSQGGLMVRLVDLGVRKLLPVEEVTSLAEELREEHAYSFLCHLPGCEGVEERVLEEVLEGRKAVFLHRRGSPELRAGAWSMPVELSWKEEDFMDPVGPPASRTVFLSQRLLSAKRVSAGQPRNGGFVLERPEGVPGENPVRFSLEQGGNVAFVQPAKISSEQPARSSSEQLAKISSEQMANNSCEPKARRSNEQPIKYITKQPGEISSGESVKDFLELRGRVCLQQPGKIFSKRGMVSLKQPGRVSLEHPKGFSSEQPGRDSLKQPVKVFLEQPGRVSSKQPKSVSSELPVRVSSNQEPVKQLPSLTETLVMSSEEEDACPPSPSLHRSREVCSSFQWTAALPPPARSFKARVVSVEAGGLLFLQLSGLRSQYKELSARMEKVLGSSQPDCGRESFLPRQPVMARWWDGVWYRAVFWAYTLHPGHAAQATVTFVDFGNTDCVAVADLRSRLVGTGLPIFALSAVLGGVAPVGGEWSPGTLDFLAATLCDTPASLRVRLLAGGGARDRPLQVALELPPSGPGLPWVQLTDLLLLQGGCVRSPQGEEARERGTLATPPPPPMSPHYRVDATVLGEVAATALQDLVPGEVFSCRFLRLSAWDTALVRLEPGQGIPQ